MVESLDNIIKAADKGTGTPPKKTKSVEEAYHGYSKKEGRELADIEEHFAVMHERKEDQEGHGELSEAEKDWRFVKNEKLADNPSAEAEKRAMENYEAEGKDRENPIEEMRIKMEEAGQEYARSYGEARANRKWLQRILDVNVEEKNEDVKKAKNEYLRLQEEYVKLVGEDARKRAAKGDMTEQEALRKMEDMGLYLKVINGTLLADMKTEETMKANEKKGFWSKNVIRRCDKAVDWYRKLPLGKKLIFSAAAVGLGLGAVLTGAAFLTWLSSGAIMSIRALGSGSAGKGIQEFMQARSQKKGKQEENMRQEELQAILAKEGESLEQKLAAAQTFLEKDVQMLGQRFSKNESEKVRNRRIGVLAGIGLFAAGTAFQLYRAGWFGGIGKGTAIMPEKIPFHGGTHTIQSGRECLESRTRRFCSSCTGIRV